MYGSPPLRKKPVRQWLQFIEPVEQLLNAVLQVVHPQLWSASCSAMSSLLDDPPIEVPCWPTVYSGMDVIANRSTPGHFDRGGAHIFYDHLVNFGQDHDARFCVDDLEGQFVYRPGTSILLTGKLFKHSVPPWAGGERIVIAHYSKDAVHHRLEVERPSLPNQTGWWNKFSRME